MTRRCMLACVSLACAVVLGMSAQGALASPSLMVDMINDLRAEHGLKALDYSPSLTRSSRRYARYMVNRQSFAHAARIRASSRFSKLGEILARTPGIQPDWGRTLDDWLASPPHRAILLSQSFSRVGAGRADNGLGGEESAVVWAVQFGRY